MERERERLEAAMRDAQLQAAPGEEGAETLVYGYHDPFMTPNFLRKNEVALRVKQPADA